MNMTPTTHNPLDIKSNPELVAVFPSTSTTEGPVLAMGSPHVHVAPAASFNDHAVLNSSASNALPHTNATTGGGDSTTDTIAVFSLPLLDQLPPQGPIEGTLNTAQSAAGVSNDTLATHTLDSTATATATAQQQRQRSKEQMIAHVIQRGKILKVSRRLRTRLEYAVLKIRRGWSKYTLQEVESLLETTVPGLSSASHPGYKRTRSPSSRSTIITSSSRPGSRSGLRQSERKRTRKEYPDYEGHSVLVQQKFRDISGADEAENEEEEDDVEDMEEVDMNPPPRIYRTRPSFSQFKDSELFLPAKSLMEIATSSPSPSTSPRPKHAYAYMPQQQQLQIPGLGGFGTAGPLFRDATPGRDRPMSTTYSTPASPVMTSSPTMRSQDKQEEDGEAEEEEEGEGGPSDTQAARTILLLASSPTRPPPRTLNVGSRHASPSPSPTVQQQAMFGEPLFLNLKSPSSATTGASPVTGPASSGAGVGAGAGAGIGLMASYSPMTSSPLVKFQTAASTPSPDRSPSGATVVVATDENDHTDDGNPFLVKKGIKESSLGSNRLTRPSSGLHEPMEPSSLSAPPQQSAPGFRSDINTAADRTTEVLRENPENTTWEAASVVKEKPPLVATGALPHTPQGPQQGLEGSSAAPLGIRTPPPSGNQDLAQGGLYGHRHSPSNTVAQSIAARRRNSGLAGGTGVDLLTFFPRPGQSPLEHDNGTE